MRGYAEECIQRSHKISLLEAEPWVTKTMMATRLAPRVSHSEVRVTEKCDKRQARMRRARRTSLSRSGRKWNSDRFRAGNFKFCPSTL